MLKKKNEFILLYISFTSWVTCKGTPIFTNQSFRLLFVFWLLNFSIRNWNRKQTHFPMTIEGRAKSGSSLFFIDCQSTAFGIRLINNILSTTIPITNSSLVILFCSAKGKRSKSKPKSSGWFNSKSMLITKDTASLSDWNF